MLSVGTRIASFGAPAVGEELDETLSESGDEVEEEDRGVYVARSRPLCWDGVASFRVAVVVVWMRGYRDE